MKAHIIHSPDEVSTYQHAGPFALILVDPSGDSINRVKELRAQTSAHHFYVTKDRTSADQLASKFFPETGAPEKPKPPIEQLRIAVVVTCHTAYLPFLPDCIASIDAQHPNGEKTLVLDGCDYAAPKDWRVIRGDWSNPNPARNAGWRASRCRWICFWDADDVMPPGYLAAQAEAVKGKPEKLGISYPQVTRANYPNKTHAPWDYWEQRRFNTIITPGIWSKKALECVGGWPEDSSIRDDLALALKVTAYGFTAHALPSPPVIQRLHDLGHRSRASTAERAHEALWQSQTFAIVTIHCGRAEEHLEDWVDWLATAELPPNVTLHAIDSSGSDEFRTRLGNALHYVEKRFQQVSVYRWRDRGAEPLGNRRHFQRHADVAEDYSRTLRRIPDDFVLITDDDTVAPANALVKLHGHFTQGTDLGAAGGAYVAARHANRTVGSRNKQRWSLDIPWPCPAETIDVGFLGGGCTLFANWALQRCLPICATWDRDGQMTEAWDNAMGRKLRAEGFRMLLDGTVVCTHNFC